MDVFINLIEVIILQCIYVYINIYKHYVSLKLIQYSVLVIS